MGSISIDRLRTEIDSYIAASKSTSGDRAIRFINRAETALRSYDDLPEQFVSAYSKLIEDLKRDVTY